MGMYPYGHLWFGTLAGENPFYPRLVDGEPDWDALDNADHDFDFYDLGEWLAFRAGEENPGYDRERELEADAPIELLHLGSEGGDGVWGFALKDTHQSASWNGPVEVKIEPVTDEQIEAAQRYCAANGLPAFDDPKWLMFASYG